MERPWLKFYDKEVPHPIDYPRIPLYRLLDDTAAARPDKPCTCFFGRRESYRRIKDFSDRFAAALRGLSIQKGDRVALLLPNLPPFIIAYYGILKAGAVVVPLNPLYTERELTDRGRHRHRGQPVSWPAQNWQHRHPLPRRGHENRQPGRDARPATL